MSRIGKKPIVVPAGVKVSLDTKTRTVAVDGPKGKLSFPYRSEVEVTWDETEKHILCSITEEQTKFSLNRSLWGTTRACIQNIITGVTEGYSKRLEIVGVGWNAQAQGKSIRLNVGYCHPVELTPPAGVEFKIEGPMVTITGTDKQAVGEFAAKIRSKRPPEPYNGKGVKYVGEHIIRKQGKVFGA